MFQGRFREALTAFRRGHALGNRDPHWSSPTARYIPRCRRLRELDPKLPKVLRGEVKLAGPAEQIEFAELCNYKQLYADATRFYLQAFTARPKLAESGHRYSAACCAALAGAGRDKNDASFKEKDRAGWRKQARDWLRADLAHWASHLAQKTPAARARVRYSMNHWQSDLDLAGLRDPKALAKLPEAERKECQQLWADVKALLQRARDQ
jgi:hypothetical protein